MSANHLFSCTDCSKEFYQENDLQSHIDNTHKFPCSECALTFKTRVILVDHKDFVHKKKENEETTKDPKKLITLTLNKRNAMYVMCMSRLKKN